MILQDSSSERLVSSTRSTADANPAPDGRAAPADAAAASFVWGAGIECSFIPHLKVDQFEWTQHDRFWRDDFRRAAEQLGVSALRYALPWHKIETTPGVYDWAAADERVA